MSLKDLSYEPVELAFGTSGLRGLIADMTDLECYINVTGFLAYLESAGQLGQGDIYIAGDLRSSTPRIMQAVAFAIENSGRRAINCGFIPTPALAYYAGLQSSPCIMVTGSHIPDDRNGIKFYKSSGEVLKSDEVEIKNHVASVREKTYENLTEHFDTNGALRGSAQLPEASAEARQAYIDRYVSVFADAFTGKTVVVYQHSAVGRDMLVEILTSTGAQVIPVGRSEKFIPIDTENVTVADRAYFEQLSQEHPGCFAILSTDGDSDRPFLIDEHGIFHRGDDLGALVAAELDADFAALPISSSDGVDSYLTARNIPYEHTRIGSPYVIEAMQAAETSGKQRTMGWEVNGGFLLGSDITIGGKALTRLPTRDAFFPVLCTLKAAAEKQMAVSAIFDQLPKRYTQAGMIDNFPSDVYGLIKDRFAEDTDETRSTLSKFFTTDRGYGTLLKTNSLDGIRMYFDNGDVAHIRGSGNAPQLRIYSVADSQQRADEIVEASIADNGILREIEQYIIESSQRG